VTGRCTGRGHGLTGRVRSVQLSSQARGLGFATGVSSHSRDRRVRSGALSELQFARSIGRGARPVTHDRTRPVVEGAYWTLTGRWHCRVRSLSGARPVVASRARVLCASARPVIARSASGRCFAGARYSATGASGRLSSASGHCV
jgi:hypothetical protein